jgi:hypothetical protein
MRFALTTEYKQLFIDQGFIEFEDLCNGDQLLAQVNKISRNRNLWRENDEIKKVVMRMPLAAVASELMNVKTIRLAYDHVFTTFGGGHALREVSSIHGMIGGLILCLKGEREEPGILPLKPGNGVYFKGSEPLDLQGQGGLYLMIAYCKFNSVYTFCDKDPYTHELKKQDYVFGDRLRVDTNPIILRGEEQGNY